MRHTVPIALALIALTSIPASAQTRFQWPDTSAKVAEYTHIEDCLAANSRVSMSVQRRESIVDWRDTMPFDPHEGLEPPPPEVSQTAKQCAARFDVAKIEPREFGYAMQLFLAAGRDSDAAALVEHRLAAIPVKNTIERGAIVDTAVMLYSGAKPVRLDAADQLLLHRAKTSSDRVSRLKTYSTMLIAANNVADSVHAIRAAKLIMGVADSLTVADRQSDAFERMRDGFDGSLYIYDAIEALTGLKTRLDSLRKSTVAYGKLERANWALATGERLEALEIPIAEKATPLTADFWYPGTASKESHPGRGHTSLVVFLEHTGCIGQGSNDNANPTPQCFMRAAELRRLAKRFPTVEIDIVASTHGQFMYLPPTSPAEEAALMKQLVDSLRIPGANLSVTTTPFYRLPDPDSRRIDKELPNTAHYTFGKTWKVGSGSVFLVDSDGLIADAWRVREEELGQFIEVLLHRQDKETRP
jgi:hypothetical protein